MNLVAGTRTHDMAEFDVIRDGVDLAALVWPLALLIGAGYGAGVLYERWRAEDE